MIETTTPARLTDPAAAGAAAEALIPQLADRAAAHEAGCAVVARWAKT